MACTRGGFTRGVEGDGDPGRLAEGVEEARLPAPTLPGGGGRVPSAMHPGGPGHTPPCPVCRPLVLPLLVALARMWRPPPLLCVRPHRPGEAA